METNWKLLFEMQEAHVKRLLIKIRMLEFECSDTKQILAAADRLLPGSGTVPFKVGRLIGIADLLYAHIDRLQERLDSAAKGGAL